MDYQLDKLIIEFEKLRETITLLSEANNALIHEAKAVAVAMQISGLPEVESKIRQLYLQHEIRVLETRRRMENLLSCYAETLNNSVQTKSNL